METNKNNQFRKGAVIGFLISFACMALIVWGIYASFIIRGDGSRSSLGNTGGTDSVGNETTGSSNTSSITDESKAILKKIDLLEKYIDSEFLYETDKDTMIEGIYKGIVDSLDEPYSAYLTAEEYASAMEDYSGDYYGIGVQVSQDPDIGIVTIVGVFSDSPARESGIQPGDILYKVAGEEVTGMDLDDVVAKVKGEAGTTVSVEIYREDTDEYLEMEVERRKVTQDVVTYEMLDNSIGYIALSTFHEQSAEQLLAAIQDLEGQGMKGLILDLRNNTGGLLTSMQDIADIFLPSGKVVLTVKTKEGVDSEYKTRDNDVVDVPMVVLINGYTASASEALLGALKDHGVVDCVVGVNTFGKGIVQTYFPLGDGSAIKLTNLEYFTPNGTAIHEVGIAPDVEIELDKEAENDNQLDEAIKEMGKVLGD